MLERFDDRNAAADSGFDQHVDPCRFGSTGDFRAMACNHRFVGGHHGLAVGDGLKDQAAGRFNASDDLHHDVHIGVVDHLVWIGGEYGIGEVHRAGAIQVTDGHPDQIQIGHQGMTLFWTQQNLGHPTTNGAQPQQAYADPCAHSP